MIRIFAIIAAGLLATGFVACGNDDDSAGGDTESGTESDGADTETEEQDTETDTGIPIDPDSAYELDADTSEVNKLALLMGISDYPGSDDDLGDGPYGDVKLWYEYLIARGYEINVLGDGQAGEYYVHHDTATKANMHKYIRYILESADDNDMVVITMVGHGSGNGWGDSEIIAKDFQGYWDVELASVLAEFPNHGQLFFFLVTCFSGGFGPEFMASPNADNTYLTTTCSDSGIGYSGTPCSEWCGSFLFYGLMNYYEDQDPAMEDVFELVIPYFDDAGVDTPEEYDGNTSEPFYIEIVNHNNDSWFQNARAVQSNHPDTLAARIAGSKSVRVKHIHWTDSFEDRTITSGTVTKKSDIETLIRTANPDQRVTLRAAMCLFSHIVDYLDADGNPVGRVGICRTPEYKSNQPAVLVELNESWETLSREGIVIPDPTSLMSIVEKHSK